MERKKEDLFVEREKAIAESLLRLSDQGTKSLAKIEIDIPVYAAGILAFEKRMNFLASRSDKKRIKPHSTTLSDSVNDFLLLSRSIKGTRAKQLTEICKDGVKNAIDRKRFPFNIFGGGDDEKPIQR